LVEIGSVVSEEKIFFLISSPLFGNEIKKKSSPLKLLSQSQPTFAEMILGWSPFKFCPSVQSCIQDGRHKLGTFWLKIEPFWPFEEISIFSNGGHLGYRTAMTDKI
jgi:hypothetical protein